VLFLLGSMFAEVAPQAYPLRLKVLSAEAHAVNGGTPIPQDCDLQNYSAYCNGSRNPSAQNVMLVQDADGKSFSITCTVDSRWSRCTSLTVGESFQARKEKHGITVVYRDAKGKERKQLFQMVATAQASPSPASPDLHSQAAEAVQNTTTAPTPATGTAPSGPGENVEKVKCKFISTPTGAEVTLDGKYVGSTPSELLLSTGTHVVVFSLLGFGTWKRELTVSPESQLTVNAVLQKVEP